MFGFQSPGRFYFLGTFRKSRILSRLLHSAVMETGGGRRLLMPFVCGADAVVKWSVTSSVDGVSSTSSYFSAQLLITAAVRPLPSLLPRARRTFSLSFSAFRRWHQARLDPVSQHPPLASSCVAKQSGSRRENTLWLVAREHDDEVKEAARARVWQTCGEVTWMRIQPALSSSWRGGNPGKVWCTKSSREPSLHQVSIPEKTGLRWQGSCSLRLHFHHNTKLGNEGGKLPARSRILLLYVNYWEPHLARVFLLLQPFGDSARLLWTHVHFKCGLVRGQWVHSRAASADWFLIRGRTEVWLFLAV